jgi:RNA polymerase sigma factor (sigma-70 family)
MPAISGSCVASVLRYTGDADGEHPALPAQQEERTTRDAAINSAYAACKQSTTPEERDAALHRLIKICQPSLEAVAYKVCVRAGLIGDRWHDEAASIAQLALVQALNSETFDSRSNANFASYARSAAHNLMKTLVDAELGERRLLSTLHIGHADYARHRENRKPDGFLAEGASKHCYSALRDISTAGLGCLQLKLRGLSYKRIAAEQNLSEVAVRRELHVAYEALKRNMDEAQWRAIAELMDKDCGTHSHFLHLIAQDVSNELAQRHESMNGQADGKTL